MALVAEEAAAAWPGFVLLHYCQTFHWVSVGVENEDAIQLQDHFLMFHFVSKEKKVIVGYCLFLGVLELNKSKFSK